MRIMPTLVMLAMGRRVGCASDVATALGTPANALAGCRIDGVELSAAVAGVVPTGGLAVVKRLVLPELEVVVELLPLALTV